MWDSYRLLVFAAVFSSCMEPTPAADPPSIVRVSPPGVQAGQTVGVKFSGKPGDGQLQIWSDRNELEVHLSEAGTEAEVRASENAAPGVHWLRFFNPYGTSGLIPFFVGRIPEVAEVEPNNDLNSAQPIDQPSALVNGVLHKSGEVDVYSVSLQAGQTLVASMQANRELGSPMDGVLQVLDAHGTVIDQNDDDHGFDPFLAFRAAASGRYFVRTFAFPATPNSSIRMSGAADYVYRLMLTTEGFADHCTPSVLQRGQAANIRMHGWNLPSDSTPARVSIPENNGVSFEWSVPSAANSVRFQCCDVPVLDEEAQHPDPFLVPFAVSGHISTDGETDAFVFEGKKGQKVTVRAICREQYSLLDPVLTLKSIDGTVVKESDDRSRTDFDSEATVALKEDGQYRLEIHDRFRSGSDRHFYTVVCDQAVPDCTATAEQSAFVLTPEKAVEVSIAIGRLNGFTEAISFSAVGLPDGVEAKAVVSEPKGDSSKKVTLELTAEDSAPPFSGVIRIIGSAGDQETPVTVPIPNVTDRMSEIWLTVKPSEK